MYKAAQGRDESDFDKYLTKKLKAEFPKPGATAGWKKKKQAKKFHRKH